MCAWKSGRKPSAKRETINSIIPKNSVSFYDFFREGSANLKRIIPKVTISPITIFFIPSLSFLSFTREQRTPTRITERMLQDLNIITTGKLVR
jgi:hypothetical protein